MRRIFLLVLVCLVSPVSAQSTWNSSTGSTVELVNLKTKGLSSTMEVVITAVDNRQARYPATLEGRSFFCNGSAGRMRGQFIGKDEIRVSSDNDAEYYWTRRGAPVSTAVPNGRTAQGTEWRDSHGNGFVTLMSKSHISFTSFYGGIAHSAPARWTIPGKEFEYTLNETHRVRILDASRMQDGQKLLTRVGHYPKSNPPPKQPNGSQSETSSGPPTRPYDPSELNGF